MRRKGEVGKMFEGVCLRRGVRAVRRGWPDYFCIKGGSVCLVEVRYQKNRELRPEQLEVMRGFMAYGVPCYRWSPTGGWEEVKDLVSEPGL